MCPSKVATVDSVDIGMMYYEFVKMGTGPLFTNRAMTGVGDRGVSPGCKMSSREFSHPILRKTDLPKG